MNIIAHRGFWTNSSEKNSKIAFERALELGFGIETDFRDFDSKIVVSHDIPDENCMNLADFINLIESINSKVTLAINVKSDGLQSIFKKNEKLKNLNHFFFDMSVPDCLGYQKCQLPYYTRFSDIELSPSLYDKSEGVWLDNFSTGELNLDMLEKFILDGKKVALVSPELHSFEHLKYWESLKNFLSNKSFLLDDSIALCTDFPIIAKEFFCDKND
jgi:glycerophosphoryl diester phosphodiesterase